MIQPRVTASRRRRVRGFRLRAAAIEFCRADQQFELPFPNAEPDVVAVLHEAERPARRGVGRDMEHNRSIGRPAHAGIGNADHVLYASLGELRRYR